MTESNSILRIGRSSNDLGKEKRRNSGVTKDVSFPEDDESFVQVVCEVESCFEFTDEQKKTLWFTRSDYHFSRTSARVIAKESERYGHSKHLDDAYVTSYSQHIQDQLNLWTLHGHSRRGLERWASTAHGLHRKDDQYMYINGLLRAQQEMKLKDEYSHERLREVGHILSRKSRLFAHMMGSADAEAAKWINIGMNSMGGMIVSPQQQHRQQQLLMQQHHHRRPINLGLQHPPPHGAQQQRRHHQHHPQHHPQHHHRSMGVPPIRHPHPHANARLPSRRVSDSQPVIRNRGMGAPHPPYTSSAGGAAPPAAASSQRRPQHPTRPAPKIKINTPHRGPGGPGGGRQARMA